MTDSIFETAVFADGVITIPLEREKKMAIDLPENFAGGLLADTAGNIQSSNRNSRFANDAVMAAISGTVQTNFAEVGVLEGRTVSGVNGTPMAGPTAPATA